MQQEESSQRGTDEEMNMVSASIEKLQDYNVNAADINLYSERSSHGNKKRTH